MTNDHSFFFQAGRWVGKGTISLTLSDDSLAYETTWKVLPERGGVIHCTQMVRIEGSGEQVINELQFSQLESGAFAVQLDNVMIGSVPGKGLVDSKVVAWEYKDNQVGFEGFEVYQRLEANRYAVNGEYASDETRTKIKGEIQRVED